MGVHTCQSEATHWTDAWTTFGTHEKDWAYRQDQLSSTHPIVAEIHDLQDVEVNFDGITYAKGASVLKQLVAHVGREPFRDGLRAYFAKHAWGNTTLDDLLSELEATSGRDLRAWSRQWLETAGVSTLRPVLEVDDRGRIASAAIEQTCAPGFETLRPHTLGIGLYAVRDGLLERTDRLELDIDGRAHRGARPRRPRAARPAAVNDEDLAYAKIRLDERSLATAWRHPRGFTSSLPRSLVLASLWDMTRDAEMGARYFVDVVLDTLPGESDSTLLRTLISQLQTAVHTYSAPEHRAALRLVDPRPALGARPFRRARQRRPAAAGQRDRSPHRHRRGGDTAHLRALLDGTEVLDGLTVDFEMRWTLLTALVAAGAADADEIDAELRPRGHRHRRASGPPWPEPRSPPPRPRSTPGQRPSRAAGCPPPSSRSAALGFTRPGTSPDLLRPFVERYHAMLDTVHEPRLARPGRVDRLRLLPPPPRRRRPARPHPGLARRQPARPRRPAPPRRGEPRPRGAGPGGPGA